MRRNVLRPLWVVLALAFLLEAWLWDHLEPIVARIVNIIPWGKLKIRLTRLLERLPPYAALGFFVVPFIAVLPLKFLEVYFIATFNWLGAVVVLVLAKLVGLGVTAFVFEVTRDKLLQIGWFYRMYEWFLWLRDWCRDITEPVRERLRQLRWLLRPQRAGRFLRRFMRLRRRAYRSKTA